MTTQLNTLLRLRQYEVDRCQSQLAAATLLEQTLTAHIQELDRQRDKLRTELSTLLQHGQLNIDALQLRQRHLQLLTEQRSQSQAAVDTAIQATQLQRTALLAADQRRQVIEILRERLLQETQTQQQRSAIRDLEEAWHDSR